MWKEFKEFAFKGNVLDMAIGVIIGGAFSAIVTSLVNDIIMPLIGLLTGGVDFSTLSVALKDDAVLTYGAFIQSIIDFLLIALSIFFFIKLISKLHKKKDEEPIVEEVKAPTSEELLTEIRDLLKTQNSAAEETETDNA